MAAQLCMLGATVRPLGLCPGREARAELTPSTQESLRRQTDVTEGRCHKAAQMWISSPTLEMVSSGARLLRGSLRSRNAEGTRRSAATREASGPESQTRGVLRLQCRRWVGGTMIPCHQTFVPWSCSRRRRGRPSNRFVHHSFAMGLIFPRQLIVLSSRCSSGLGRAWSHK